MSSQTKITSYKLTLRAKRKLEQYALNLKTSKAKIINYALYEIFVKNEHKITAETIASYIKETKLNLKPDSYTFHLSFDYYDRIVLLKNDVQIINYTEYHDNEFIGILLSFYFDKVAIFRKKKVDKYLIKETKPSQIGLYLNKDLKDNINEICNRYQLNAGVLIFDILTDIEFGDLPFKNLPQDVVINSEEKERIIIFIPPMLHKQLKETPLSNSFIAEIRAEQYLKKYNLKR
ncbi:hypothetical protein [Priestia flexa]|uniref:hypothetical protein n=1 Tax=Priestia flexa TaxID=86664 RepID=UPI00077C4F4A|nr:hypothetical protein [Priestia flexa]MED4587862.1 hypothetical protein [Priestia flexa]